MAALAIFLCCCDMSIWFGFEQRLFAGPSAGERITQLKDRALLLRLGWRAEGRTARARSLEPFIVSQQL